MMKRPTLLGAALFACLFAGALVTHAKNESSGDAGSIPCAPKGFLAIARSPSATKAQQETISAVMRSVQETDTERACEKVKTSKTLLLYGDPVYLSDLTPLSEFTNLETLVLYNNHISDLSPLAPLTNLLTLRLERNRIEDITPLNHFKNLECLQIDDNNISDLGPLSQLQKLRSLWISRNRISDLGPLSQLQKLRNLWISRNRIQDISALRTLKSLRALDLTGNSVTNLETLSHMSLSDLRLSDNGLSDVSMLRHLNQAISCHLNLDLSSNSIDDIEPIGSLACVSILDLNNNSISDISSLNNPNLSDLLLASNRVVDVSTIRNLRGLQLLDIRNNPIKDYSPLLAIKREKPTLVIRGDKRFQQALRDSVPVKDHLKGSVLLGLWRTDVLDTEFGGIVIEMKFEENGLYYTTLRSEDTNEAGAYPVEGSFTTEGSKLKTTVAGEESEAEYEAAEDSLILRQDGGTTVLHRIAQ